MAKLIKCPRCQSQFDGTNVPAGSTTRCPDCGGLVRIPSGSTGPVPQATAPDEAPAPASKKARPGRQTALFRKMQGVRAPGDRSPLRGGGYADARAGTRHNKGGSNPMLVIGAAVGALALVVVLIVVANKKGTAAVSKTPAPSPVVYQEPEPVEAAPDASDTKPKKGPSLRKDEKGAYQASATYEPGARKMSRAQGGEAEQKLDAAKVTEYEGLASAGKVAEIVKLDYQWLPYILEGLVSDDEKIGRSSLQALHDMCDKRGILTEKGANPVNMSLVNSAHYRGGEFSFWTLEWWSKSRNQQAVAEWAAKEGGTAAVSTVSSAYGGNAEKENWSQIMIDLRPGGNFDDPKRPEGKSFSLVKSMGKSAYPHLIKFIDHEDIAIGKAAVVVLNTLTERNSDRPNEATRGQIKAEWEKWLAEQK